MKRSTDKLEFRRHDDLQRIKTIEFDKDAEWVEMIKVTFEKFFSWFNGSIGALFQQRQFTYKRIQGKKWTQPTKDVYLMVKAYDDPKYEEVTIEATDLKLNDWIFGCKMNQVHQSNI